MQIVRRYRRAILALFAIAALATMTYGFLRRVGIDPLAQLRSDAREER